MWSLERVLVGVLDILEFIEDFGGDAMEDAVAVVKLG